jgi:hypothetical protein
MSLEVCGLSACALLSNTWHLRTLEHSRLYDVVLAPIAWTTVALLSLRLPDSSATNNTKALGAIHQCTAFTAAWTGLLFCCSGC